MPGTTRILIRNNQWLTLLFLIPLSLTFIPPVYARNLTQETTRCVSLDIVVLLDQSASMEVNDRLQLRIRALHNVVEYLADLSLFFCPSAEHRLAVVGFGDLSSNWRQDVREYFNQTIAPIQLADWQNQRVQIYEQMPQPENLGSTDFISALRKAEEILQDWARTPSTGPYPRRRVIFLITDGGPCVVDKGCKRDNIATFNMRKEMEEIQNFIDFHFPWRGAESENSVFLAGIALNDQKYDYWPLVGDTWRTLSRKRGADFLPVPTDEPNNVLLVRRVYELLSFIAPFPFDTYQCRQDILVPPYRGESLTLHIWHFPSPEPRLSSLAELTVQTSTAEIRYKNGQPNLPTTVCRLEDYYQPTEFSERYLFKPACPGVYRVDVPGSGLCKVEIYTAQGPSAAIAIAPQSELIETEAVSQLPVETEPPYYNSLLKPHFVIRLYYPNTPSQPITPLPEYPIQFCVRVTHPNGQVQWYTQFHYDETQQAFVDTTEYIKTPQAGIYTVETYVLAPSPAWVVQGRYPAVDNPQAFCEQVFKEGIPEGWLSPLIRVKRGQDKIILEPRKIESTFSARLLPSFHIQWIQPEPQASSLLLMRINPEGESIPQPITIQVRLVQENGDPVDPHQVFQNPEAGPLNVLLYPENQPEAAVTAKLQPHPNQQGLWTGRLIPGENWKSGRYYLEIGFEPRQIKLTAFQPPKQTIRREITGMVRYQVEPYLQIEGGGFTPWRSFQDFLRTLKGESRPLVLRLSLQHQGKAMPFNQLFGESPIPTLEGSLRLPDGSQRSFQLQPDEEAYWAVHISVPALEGEYLVQIPMEDITLTPAYEIAGKGNLPLKIPLQTPWYNQPTFVRFVGAIISLIAILILGVIYQACFNGPEGTLQLLDSWRKEVDMWTLHRWFTCFGRNRFEVNIADIGRIQVTKERIERDEEGTYPVIRVKIYDIENALLDDQEMAPEEEISLPEGYILRYRR